MSTTLQILPYRPIPETITKPLCQKQETLDAFPETYAVVWVVSHYFRHDNETQHVKRRTLNHLWYETYNCHRAGSKDNRHSTQSLGGKSGLKRKQKKESKKIGCPATMKITCFKDDPDNIVFTFNHQHNHVLGSSEDIQHLPVSKHTKQFILDRLGQGFTLRRERVMIQRHLINFIQQECFSNTAIFITSANTNIPKHEIYHRDQILDYNDIYNLYKGIQEQHFKYADDQHESVKIWLDKLRQEKKYYASIGQHYESSFTFFFMSPWQQHILAQSKQWCLDITYKSSSFNNSLLYTVIVRHPITETGCPVAHCFTTDPSSSIITEFLSFLKDNDCTRVQHITANIPNLDLQAFNIVYPEAQVEPCFFYITRIWMDRIRETIRTRRNMNSVAHKKTFSHLKSIMWEKDIHEFDRKVNEFTALYSTKYPDLHEYLTEHYFNNHRDWAACYQPEIYNNMKNCNYMENWHCQLKAAYLRRTHTRRVDRLVFILVCDMEDDYQRHIQGLVENMNKVGPEQRRQGGRMQIEAENFNQEALPDMISEINQNCFSVQSLTNEGLSYTIQIENNKIISCSCNYFISNSVACKHMYLLNCLKPTIHLFGATLGDSDIVTVMSDPAMIFEETNRDNVTHVLANVLLSYRTYLESPSLLSENDIAAISAASSIIEHIINRNIQNTTM